MRKECVVGAACTAYSSTRDAYGSPIKRTMSKFLCYTCSSRKNWPALLVVVWEIVGRRCNLCCCIVTDLGRRPSARDTRLCFFGAWLFPRALNINQNYQQSKCFAVYRYSEVTSIRWRAYVFVICYVFKRSANIFSSMAFPAPVSRQRWILSRIGKKSRHTGNWKALYMRRSVLVFVSLWMSKDSLVARSLHIYIHMILWNKYRSYWRRTLNIIRYGTTGD